MVMRHIDTQQLLIGRFGMRTHEYDENRAPLGASAHSMPCTQRCRSTEFNGLTRALTTPDVLLEQGQTVLVQLLIAGEPKALVQSISNGTLSSADARLHLPPRCADGGL